MVIIASVSVKNEMMGYLGLICWSSIGMTLLRDYLEESNAVYGVGCDCECIVI